MASVVGELGASVWNPLVRLWYGVVDAVPGIVAAIIVLIVGYVIACIIGRIVRGILEKVKFDKWVVQKTNLERVVGAFKLSRFLGLIAKWYTFILFLPTAASLIYLEPLSKFLLEVARWIPHVIVAIILAIIGLMAADYVAGKIEETKAKAASTIAWIAKIAIYVFTVLVVLSQIGIKVQVATSALLIILGGVMLGVGLALGIGFGLALKEDAKAILQKIKKKV